MADLDDLKKLVVDFINERDWNQFHNPKDLAISLNLESSELLEHFQWKNEKEIKTHSIDHKEELEDELSDVLYWVLLIANKLDINLDKSFKSKMAKNAKKYPINKAKGKHLKYTEL